MHLEEYGYWVKIRWKPKKELPKQTIWCQLDQFSIKWLQNNIQVDSNFPNGNVQLFHAGYKSPSNRKKGREHRHQIQIIWHEFWKQIGEE